MPYKKKKNNKSKSHNNNTYLDFFSTRYFQYLTNIFYFVYTVFTTS